jgi:septal ring factor EnvC (AmiA/AmiB activator)
VYYDAPELRFLVSVRNDGIDDGPVNIPEEKPFVDDDPTKDPDYSGWGNASAGIAYIQLVPYLIKAVQEIHQTHQTTKTELKADLSETKADLSETKADLQTTRTELAEERALHETTRTQLRNTQTELDVAKIKLLNIEARMQIIESNISKVVV